MLPLTELDLKVVLGIAERIANGLHAALVSKTNALIRTPADTDGKVDDLMPSRVFTCTREILHMLAFDDLLFPVEPDRELGS